MFKGEEGQTLMFGDPANLAMNSPDHPLASGLQQIRREHGSGLKGYFANRPTFTNSIGIKFVWCPENARAEEEFQKRARENQDRGFGTPDLRNRKFTTRGFWISETELTRAQWAALMGSVPSDPDLPLTNVSFEQGKLFCKLLTDCEQNSRCLPLQIDYDLPTEAEWEYARDTGGEVNAWRGEMKDQAWLADNSDGKIHPVKMLPANAWGIHDMIGNAREHVQARRQPGMAGGRFKSTLDEMQKYGGASQVFGESPSKATSSDLGLRLIIRL
jgi:formylglycine-generating enzyme required for sulfatase activity